MYKLKTILIFVLIWINVIDVFSQIDCNHEVLSEVYIDDFLFMNRSGAEKKNIDRIISQDFKNGKLVLEFGFNLTSGGEFSCNVEEKSEGVYINFTPKPEYAKDGYEEYIDATGTFQEVRMNIDGLKQEPRKIFLNKKEIKFHEEEFVVYPEKFEVVDGDTINRLDKYGQKQGKWVETNCVFGFQEFEYLDSEVIKGKETSYYETGEKLSEHYFPIEENTHVIVRDFYRTGEIKAEEYKIEKTGLFKKKWHITGEVQQETYFDGEQIILTINDDKGNIKCKCETKIGIKVFKRKTSCGFKDTVEIPCMFYDKEGKEIGERLKKININSDL